MILAIDPSINNTGWALLDAGKISQWGVIKTSKKGSIVERLSELYEGIASILNGEVPGTIKKAFVEVPGGFSYQRSSGASGNPLNMQSLLTLSEAVGCICTVLTRHGIEVMRVLATQWKAKRTKELEQSIASSIVGRKVTHDEADAILLAIYCERR